MHANDTIFATSSAAGAGWRGIVRLSGPEAWGLALGQCVGGIAQVKANHIYAVTLAAAELPAMLLLMQTPRSFTGEDVAELHIPGGPALGRMIEEGLASAGGRRALPGEFTARAFFNGKMDLTQAEGIAATIAAQSQRQLRAAEHLREGALHQWTAATAETLAHLLALVEAGIDFSEEEGVSFISPAQVRQGLADLRGRIAALVAGAVRWERLDAGSTVAFVGKPNVGKSSLINALSGTTRALVSPVAGTTRDALTAVMPHAGGEVIRLVDVAGEEQAAGEIAAKMNAAAERAAGEADLVVRVSAAGDAPPTVAADEMWVVNKEDLAGAGQITVAGLEACTKSADVVVSARTGAGLERLRALIVQKVTSQGTMGLEYVTLNLRHRRHLAAAATTLQRAQENSTDEFVRHYPELLATELRQALDEIGQISGTIAPDEILGRIFGTFCIGK